jgi:CRP-like cAMP-binding protein
MQSKEILKEHVMKIVSLTDDQFDYFFSRFKHQSYKKGQVIIEDGDKVECEYFVLNGCLKSFYINEDVKMFILQFAIPTWRASDYNALYSGAKATICVDCITDTEVLCLLNADREEL